MLYTYPDYYKKFYCLMDKCPKSCCEGWQIVIDENTIEKYISCEGSFGNRLKNSVDFDKGMYKQYNKRCAFLNEDNLCDIHIEAGRGMMCDTCKNYPYHTEEFENEREMSLALSCPMVAEMILSNKNKVSFITVEDDKEEIEDDDFDFFLYSALEQSRKIILEIIQNRSEDIFIRINKVLILCEKIQECIEENNIFNIENILVEYEDRFKNEEIESIYNKWINKKNANKILRILDEFELLDEKWNDDKEKWNKLICEKNIDLSFEVNSQIQLEQILVYFIYVYFSGGVYDYDIISKIGIAVLSTYIWDIICKIQESILKDRFCENDKIELAWRYSRELEHSDVNINRMEEIINKYNLIDLFL